VLAVERCSVSGMLSLLLPPNSPGTIVIDNGMVPGCIFARDVTLS